jgi:hypothetical protein
MTGRRLRAPAIDGGLLAEPPPGELAARLADNAARLAGWDHDFQGRPASWLRATVRREVLTQAQAYLRRHRLAGTSLDLDDFLRSGRPLIVTGHQPELFHPGVWIKNFVAHAIAGARQGVALNLIVDNDIPKSTAILVPVQVAGGMRTARVDFDRWGSDAPFEDSRVLEEEQFQTFATRVHEAAGGLVQGPLLNEFWPKVLARRPEARTHGSRFSLARRELEAEWGVTNLEVPMSVVCQTDGFLWFVSHLLAQLPRYLQVHNAALAEYRGRHGIRSKNHPVAALADDGEWREAPFWIWRADQPRRRPLLARQHAGGIDLRIGGEDEVLMELPLSAERSACCAVERLRELAAQSIRLRTRALTTTLFSRFLLGDLFIHGIGGAKYDELGDEVSRRFLGIEPPGFLTVSMTLWLGLAGRPPVPAGVTAIDRELRDLQHNPERHLAEPVSEEIRSMIQRKREAIAGPVTSRALRAARCKVIRSCNEWLRAAVEDRRVELLGLKAQARQDLRSLRVARNREFSFVLHSAERLRGAFQVAASQDRGWCSPAAIAGSTKSSSGTS